MKKLFLPLAFVCFNYLSAQTNEQKPYACCTENHHQFDFWLGNWTVYNVGGKVIGNNTNTKLYDECVLKEAFRGIYKKE